jgi:signal peptide peptidase SppA
MLHSPVRESFERQLLAIMQNGGPFASSPTPQAGPAGTPGRPSQEHIEFVQDWQATQKQLRLDKVLKVYGNVAVVRVNGVIDKKLTQFEMDCYGGCDLEDVDAALAMAAANPKVSDVVLDFHSPGGSVTGTPETAARVAEMRKTKEMHAFVSTMCCSAAYYIASQADVIAAAPSAIVGSIGVYMAILDQTRKLEDEGLKVELIKAGRLKAMGASFKALTDEERDILQAEVDSIWSQFKAACTTLRPVSEADMQGQWFNGAQGKERKMVDAVTNASLDEYVAGLLLR